MSECGAGEFISVVMRGVELKVPTFILTENQSSKLSRTLTDYAQKKSLAGRDPTIFGCIIGFYTSGCLHVPRGTCATLVKEELEFWEIPVKALCLSCFKGYKEGIDDVADVENCIKLWLHRSPSNSNNVVDVSNEPPNKEDSEHFGKRQKLRMLLDEPSSSKFAVAYAVFILIISLLSVLLQTIQTVSRLRDPLIISNSSGHHNMHDDMFVYPRLYFNTTNAFVHATKAKRWFTYLDLTLIIILTMDLILRFIAAKKRCHFFKSVINIIGILSIAPIWIETFLGEVSNFVDVPMRVRDGIDALMMLVILRVVYLFRVAQWYTPMRIILLALKESRRELCLLIVILMLNSILYGFIIYTVEIDYQSFWSIPEGIYWAVITMTTVGYGDMYPVGSLGKVIGCLCAISGILVIALPVPVIANNFIKFYSISKLTSNHE